jgi:peptidoglycan/xylan/chitin deacetylase (PgdA/CDA1 family)
MRRDGPARFTDPRDRAPYSPIALRPRIVWPGGARLALWIAPNVEHYEYQPPHNPHFNVFRRTPLPDVQQYAFRDYGNRIGFYRMAEALDRHGIRATVSLNLAVLDHYPGLKDEMVGRGWAFMSHGIYNTRPVYGLSEAEERAMLADSVETLRRHTGKPLKGMLGPTVSATYRTPDLMAEAGLTYHTDWIHDDQPVPILVETGRLISVPYSFELNDAVPMAASVEQFARNCKRQFDRLWREGEESGRVMCVALHPYLMGQPAYRERLDEILAHLTASPGVWVTTADEIADYFLEHCYDDHLACALALQERYG